MKIVRVQVEGETFEVAVGDLQARPVVAVIDGQRFEVWPSPGANGSAKALMAEPAQALPAAPAVGPARDRARAGAAVTAPLPGVIVEISVQPGDAVAIGQPLVTIEAMKMKNVVRAARAGRVAAVRVAVGQTVKHRSPLVEYAAEPG
jgi:biotin carboxyl carrier protein